MMAKQTRQGHDDEQSKYDWHKLINFSNLMKLPSTLGTLRSFFDAVNWNAAEKEVRDELKRKIVIAGVANTGKSTLFNKIQGRYRSEVSPVAGTTLNPIRGAFGPFVLVDTPGHLPDVQEESAHNATAILQLIDVTLGLRPADRELFARLKKLKRPLIVALNKIDALKSDPESIAADIAAQLGVDDVIPISG
ncbi:MAG TPA: GTPase domain-containing protein, partial [Ktedonobacterales bacterium]|nr:GTPase domain-containing protein [Ktedonobacterales bacterium]